VKKNIPEVLVSNKTIVMIRARIEAIKGEGGGKGRRIRKIYLGREIEKG